MRNGWSNKVIDPYANEQRENSIKRYSVCLLLPDIPPGDWQPLNEAFVGNATHQLFLFTIAQIINYFVVRNAVDSMPASDMKAINTEFVLLQPHSGH